MNKKGRTASKFVYAMLLVLVGIMTFSALTINVVHEYGKDNVEEFQDYEEIFLEFNSTVSDIVRTGDIEDDDTNVTGLIEAAKRKVQEIWEDSQLRKAFLPLRMIKRLITTTTKLVGVTVKNSPIPIPTYTFWMLITLAGLVITFLLVKAVWEKKV